MEALRRDIHREGYADCVIFYADNFVVWGAYVRIFTNGLVEIDSPEQSITMHINNCDVVWLSPSMADPRTKIKAIKGVQDGRSDVTEQGQESGVPTSGFPEKPGVDG